MLLSTLDIEIETIYAFVSHELLNACENGNVFRGGAFPAASIAREEKCLWVEKRKLAICGDFCVMPSVEGAISSGIAAAAKFVDTLAT